ncbi:hypothetical protein [Fundidesulfovibrio putealis]|uniref:hypothetical protein n=1 Tax=Fundidesulfovibrio putealis TaxID=270496 RepID=UPI0012EB6A2F|nr:hypothetical protein [Fundidesulfovibrio putealis]
MERFTKAVRAAIAQQNWYGALALALTLPDICGRLEDPSVKSKPRYKRWWDKYVAIRYTCPYVDEVAVRSLLSSGDAKGLRDHIFHQQATRPLLSSNDAYALRCAYLHQGGDVIEGQRVRDMVNRFHVITPPQSGSCHSNMFKILNPEGADSTLEVQVDRLCNDICDGVEKWEVEVKGNAEVKARMGSLMVIHDSSGGVFF